MRSPTLSLILSFSLFPSTASGVAPHDSLDSRVLSVLQKSIGGGPQQLQLAALLLQAERMALTIKQPTLAQARVYHQVMKSLLTDDYSYGCLKNPTFLEYVDASMYQTELLGYEKNSEKVIKSFEINVEALLRKDIQPLPKYACDALLKIDLSKVR